MSRDLPRAAADGPQPNYIDRVSSVASQIGEVNDRLRSTLNRIRGAVPTAVPGKGPATAEPPPTLQSGFAAVQRELDELANLSAEIRENF